MLPVHLSLSKAFHEGRSSFGSHNLQNSMVIAMVSMGMVQMAIDQIIHMIAMRYGFVSAIGTVDMAFGVAANGVVTSALIWMRGIHFNHVFFNLAAFLMHQMPAFQIIRVPMMFYRRVPATRTVPMIF